jgi:hypothetical protein
MDTTVGANLLGTTDAQLQAANHVSRPMVPYGAGERKRKAKGPKLRFGLAFSFCLRGRDRIE